MPVLATDEGFVLVTDTGAEIDVGAPDTNFEIQSFDFSVNLLRAILWQYNNAPNLISLLQSKQDWYNTNQEQFWNDFITNIFNLSTANEFGLSVWSIILDLPLFTNNPYDPSIPTFGFDGSVTGSVNFDNGILQDQNGTTFNLPVETKRIALQLRYFQLVSSGTVPEANRMLAYVFRKYGRAFLEDYGNMHQQYVFSFPVTWDLAYIFNNLDLLPRPAGVASGWIDGTLDYFGFGPYGGQFDESILGP